MHLGSVYEMVGEVDIAHNLIKIRIEKSCGLAPLLEIYQFVDFNYEASATP